MRQLLNFLTTFTCETSVILQLLSPNNKSSLLIIEVVQLIAALIIEVVQLIAALIIEVVQLIAAEAGDLRYYSVFQKKTCSHVPMSFKKKHVLMFSCLSKRTCSHVLMSFKKTCSHVSTCPHSKIKDTFIQLKFSFCVII